MTGCHFAMKRKTAFSLVEVALALGIAAFAILSIAALVPEGLKTNQISVEETRATNLLTLLESDLLHSSTVAGKSQVFGLTAPYVPSGNLSMPLKFNAPSVNTLYTTGLKDDETVAAASQGLPFQASVIYTNVPGVGSTGPIEARLIVNWPCRSGSNADDLTDLGKVSGFVESTITFPSPSRHLATALLPAL